MIKTKRNTENDSKALLAYQENINKFKTLTPEQEQKLGDSILQGDITARNQLVEGYLGLVFKCANEMWNPHVPMDELIAAGNMGLTIAASRFDPSKSRRFFFYAIHYIRKAMRKAIDEYNSPIYIPSCAEMKFYYEPIFTVNCVCKDEDEWVRPFIDTLAAEPEYWEKHGFMKDFEKEARAILGKHFHAFDVNLLLDYAQKLNDGYTIDDLAYEYRLPVKKMKELVNEFQQRAKALNLRAAFLKAA